MLGRDRTRNLDGITYVVVQEPLTSRHERLLNRHHAVQIDGIDQPSAGFGWLTPWAATLERLLVTDRSVTDISALSRFTNLEYLALYCGTLKGRSNRVRISALRALRDFEATWFQVLDDAFASTTIETMLLETPPADVFRLSARMPALRRLDLRGARKVHEIPRLDEPSLLTHLKITLAKIDTIDGLSDHPNLESLELDSVTGFHDLRPLRNMPNLRRLVLEDCGEIQTLSVLADTKVEELILVGTTNILDGDLRAVGRRLRRAAFPQRPHYNATPADLT